MTTMSRTGMLRTAVLALALSGSVLAAASAQVPFERLRGAAEEPQNWLTYSGGYFSQRYSELDQIAPDNVGDLELQWVYQTPVMGPWQATPIVVDGVMYLTQRPNDIVALDARTGRVYWIYRHPTSPDHLACCGANNRGVAVLGDKVFMATLDAHVVAIDATTGTELWRVEVADMRLAYAFTLAPLAVDGKIIVGSTGGDQGIRGFIAALDAETGEEVWRFHTIPGPGEPGHETWEPCPPNPDHLLRPGGLEARRRRGLAHGLVRPGAEPDLLGHRQPGSRLQPRAAAGRQPLLLLGGGARRRHRGAALALPVHAGGPLRLRLGAGPGAGGHHPQQRRVQGDAVGQPQRVLLRAGPGDGALPDGPAVRVAELGRGARRQRAPRRDAAAAGRADLSGAPGRDELVLARLQPADRAVLRPGLGGLRVGVRGRAAGVRPGPLVHGADGRGLPPHLQPGARRAGPAASRGARSTTGPTSRGRAPSSPWMR